jgi:hypothetical protein
MSSCRCSIRNTSKCRQCRSNSPVSESRSAVSIFVVSRAPPISYSVAIFPTSALASETRMSASIYSSTSTCLLLSIDQDLKRPKKL